jgi:hypothetical protein
MHHVRMYSTIFIFIIFNLNVFQDLIVGIFFIQKFSLKELANMPTCNFSKIMHNIWLQQLGKQGVCLYV